MKKLVIFTFTLFLLTACTKEQSKNGTETSVSAKDPNEISLEQEPIQLKGEDGKIITVTYFAKGNDVAVKIEQAGQPDETLIAKKISTTGDPIFANEKHLWEGSVGKGGKMTDGAGNTIKYSEIEE